MKQLSLIGIGLIGGSLAAGLRTVGQVERVTACARRQETLDTARYLQLIDDGSTDLASAIAGADMVVLAVPMGAYREVFSALKPIWPEHAVVTDAGSSKLSVIEDARAVFGHVPSNFVPGHPVAGTEKSGPAAAIADLFRHRRVILTPQDDTSAAALQAVRAMWESVGAQVHVMSAQHHDEVLALTSHLPHVIAYQLIETLARLDDQREIFSFAAGGLKDLTRIASSNPQMWTDIMMANDTAVLEGLDRYIEDLQALRELLAAGDAERVLAHFERAKNARDQWIHTAEAS
ncbi:Prephenate dehydrogenase [Oceanococcus atlanticus]|uniref:prephenate dehydrogenase n=1 Tax=Oceanococcus atlanticus TaxID=1317117 RepID=A0A1Y1SGF8_9GAMM|nr:prephenate dehydrogenase/arogenate dehydrogenase family protein [Oceanococcus atlanticus]ORE88279.1 Prephenate dehydrogenase [Oceanococcus atlanticus]RZO85633.1 MAG: prephenate dehydrogenase/arogenate dehydrogenase family protein [Oceanococcus sp.]